MTTRVLFVDDQPNVLEGLRRSLRSQRHEWTMDFAPSGEHAMQLLRQKGYDVIVTDMRMPGMDGADLLTEVERQWPEVVRIVLSGQTQPEDFPRIIGLSHQYITKPCPPEAIVRIVKRSLMLRDRIQSSKLQRTAAALKKVPSPPEAYIKLMRVLRDPDSNLNTVAEIIEQDVGLAARVLQLANSPFFGAFQNVSTPLSAVRFLGTDRLSTLVLASGMWVTFERGGMPTSFLRAASEHAQKTAAAAKAIATAERLSSHDIGQAFTAGLLADMGWLVLALNQYETANRMMASHPIENDARLAAESTAFGADHAAIGGYLAALWGLPDPITEAITLHHAPAALAPLNQNNTLDITTIVHAAEALCQADADDEKPSGLDYEHLEALGIADHLEAWRQAIQTNQPEKGAA